jgi:hypothetical protein
MFAKLRNNVTVLEGVDISCDHAMKPPRQCVITFSGTYFPSQVIQWIATRDKARVSLSPVDKTTTMATTMAVRQPTTWLNVCMLLGAKSRLTVTMSMTRS